VQVCAAHPHGNGFDDELVRPGNWTGLVGRLVVALPVEYDCSHCLHLVFYAS
jgi:hypothetical protein